MKMLNTGHFTEVHVLSSPPSSHRCSPQSSYVPRLQNNTRSQWKQPHPVVLGHSQSLSLSSTSLHVCVSSQRRAVGEQLQGEVALLSIVVLTSTETCQARRLGLGQGQTLQER